MVNYGSYSGTTATTSGSYVTYTWGSGDISKPSPRRKAKKRSRQCEYCQVRYKERIGTCDHCGSPK